MGPKPTAGSDASSSTALDELYAARFDAFVSLRRELSARLRAAGDVAGARRVLEATKPTRTAWALNQVARRHPEYVTAILQSREAAARAQKSGDSGTIRELARQYRDAIGEAVRAVRAILASDGVALSAPQGRRVAETLQALATDETEREKLTTGRLTRDVEVEDPFAAIDVGPNTRRPKDSQAIRDPRSTKRAEEQAERAREAERVRQARIVQDKQRAAEEARAHITELDRAVAEARTTAMKAEREVRQARYEADKAQRGLSELEKKLERARETLKKIPS
jgi:hypothetical protein